jgi:hypothetical protein
MRRVTNQVRLAYVRVALRTTLTDDLEKNL